MHQSRRAILGAATAGTALAAAAPVRARWEDTVRYPDPAIEILDPSFTRYRLFNAVVERLWTGARWSEGPVWFGDMRAVFWSDIPNNRILRWDEATGRVAEFRKPSNYSNGNTRDREGRLITCEHDARRLTRTEHDGSITVLADSHRRQAAELAERCGGQSDGSIWFTDPPWGITRRVRRHPRGAGTADEYLPGGPAEPSAGGRDGTATSRDPNGLAFSPDEQRLYVMDGGMSPRVIRVFDVAENGTKLANDRVFYQCAGRRDADGFRCDDGRQSLVRLGDGPGLDGVRVINPDGKAIGHIHLPERCANLCFGGARRNRLFLAASKGLYAVYVGAQGAGSRLTGLTGGAVAGADQGFRRRPPGAASAAWLARRPIAPAGALLASAVQDSVEAPPWSSPSAARWPTGFRRQRPSCSTSKRPGAAGNTSARRSSF